MTPPLPARHPPPSSVRKCFEENQISGGGNVPPPPCGFLDAAHVQDAIVQVIEHLLVRFPAKKGAVGMHAVPCEERHASLGNMTLDVSQEAVGGLLGRHS